MGNHLKVSIASDLVKSSEGEYIYCIIRGFVTETIGHEQPLILT